MDDNAALLNEVTSRGELLIREAARSDLGFRAPLHFRSEESLPYLNYQARWLARKIADRGRGNARPVQAGHVLALGLLHEAFRIVIKRYESETNSHIAPNLPAGSDALELFLSSFPPVPEAALDVEEELQGSLLVYLVQEMLLTHISNLNPACGPLNLLIDDSALKSDPAYSGLLQSLIGPLDEGVWAEHSGKTLMQVLLEPILAHPDSLFSQLEFVVRTWKNLLGDFVVDLQRGLDVLREENQARLTGPGDVGQFIQGWLAQPDDTEAYSMDRGWMADLALIAKNTYVWLSQLTAIYGRPIRRLDEIPDEELRRLNELGMTGLWLIGVWERSNASKKIKRLMGAEDAVASAYSLHDYTISEELGGHAALDNLRARAWSQGIRLASDMVPNHMGIDSRWVVERPDWFLQVDRAPFPGYSYSGPNLSDDDRIEVYVEDHYYDQTDAAVVFKRVDRHTGEVRFIYHGNDGTSMPWNDTAQLNYLSEAVREEVIRVIVDVARQFPIIRFDAAMTLAKRHIQRLWFPEPGKGGAIPSRSQMGMSGADFDRMIPGEFWRDVVDRVAVEAPDTLLLAEAFWMMEGYFVRTLGMHRVYNSAFMHMLRDERNAEYRNAMKATVATNPQVLKRYVNFMNNPDEASAAEQFGKGDKYFGVCLLMATLPGLPMFGHGQFEGFIEKYGMEFTRPRLNEIRDQGFEDYHRRVIVPFLQHRKAFSEVDRFHIYDCILNSGNVADDVFAYSNGDDIQQFLVLYHNRHADVDIRLRDAAPHFGREGAKGLSEVLGLPARGNVYVIAKEVVSGMEYLFNAMRLRDFGLGLHLGPYEHRVYTDFRTVIDENGEYAVLAESLGGRGVFSVEEMLATNRIKSVLGPLQDVLNLVVSYSKNSDSDFDLASAVDRAVVAVSEHHGRSPDRECVSAEIKERLEFWKKQAYPTGKRRELRPRGFPSASRWLRSGKRDLSHRVAVDLSIVLQFIYRCSVGLQDRDTGRAWLGKLRVENLLDEVLQGVEAPDLTVGALKKLIISNAVLPKPEISESAFPGWGYHELAAWLADTTVAEALGLNESDGVRWVGREEMELWLWIRFASAVQECVAIDNDESAASAIGRQYLRYAAFRRALINSACRVDDMLDTLKKKSL